MSKIYPAPKVLTSFFLFFILLYIFLQVLDNSPEIEENFSGLKKIPYNLIPSKDSIEHDRQIKTDDNIIIPVPLEKELHEDSHLLLSNVPSRRHSRIEPDSTNPDKRKSTVSRSLFFLRYK